MAEYINREALRDEILNDPTFDNNTINYFLDVVDLQPSADVVEVVRCENCKHRDKSGLCQAEGQKLIIAKDNHFCSKGERRSEE